MRGPGFAFYGTLQKPRRDRLYFVNEVKVAMVRETDASKIKMDSPSLAFQFWRDTIAAAPSFDSCKEHLVALLLNTRFYLTAYNVVSVGTLNESHAHPRDVFRPAIVCAAYAVVVMHNHPSGDPSPSLCDHTLTRRLVEAAELLQIKLLDHVITGEDSPDRASYFSFKEAGIV